MSDARRHARAAARQWWFISRKDPSAIGGMERLFGEVTARLAARRTIQVIARHSATLPGFMLASGLRVLWACARRRVALLHLGDPVLAPLAAIARLFGVPTTVTLHGLDVVYAHPVYRVYRRCFLRGFDAYICIGRAARAAALGVGVPTERIHVIGIGVDAAAPSGVERDPDRLLFIGRLVQRKGLEWFVRNVLPTLAVSRARLRLVIIGDGPARASVVAAAQATRVADRLVWLGAVDDRTKADELARAAVCVMPNVAIAGDIEGFGIVALEAAAAGCPLIASRLEGLCDAVADGESGRLIAPGDAAEWLAALEQWLSDPAARDEAGRRARAHAARHCAWSGIIDRYETLLAQVADARAG